MYEKELQKIKEECLIRNRTENTAQTYVNNVAKFLEWIDGKPLDDLTLTDARNYILEKRNAGMSTEYSNTINSTLSFFYRCVLRKPWDCDEVLRMRRDWSLPRVLSLEEV